MILGCHLSVSKGFDYAIDIAQSIGANTYQFFPRNPRGSKARKLTDEEIKRFRIIKEEKNFGPILCHGAYTMNLCSDKEDIRNLAIRLIREDLERIRSLGIDHYVFHPGSHVNQGEDKGVEYIICGLKKAIDGFNDINIGLETMSGRGSEIGRNLEQIKKIINEFPNHSLGVCLDSCHLFASGYDLVNQQEEFFFQLDNIIGMDKVMAIHLNDSLMPLNSNKDRHGKIGEGEIGFMPLMKFIEPFKDTNTPIILETPNEIDGYKREIERIKDFINEEAITDGYRD